MATARSQAEFRFTDGKPLNPLLAVLAFFAGARGSELRGSERVSIPVQGGAVLVSAAWAGFAGYLVTAFVGHPSILAGFVFALLILSVDLTIMWWEPVSNWAYVAFVPRLAIIASVAFVVSLAVACWFFGSSIAQQIRTDKAHQTQVARSYVYGPTSPESKAILTDGLSEFGAANLVKTDQATVNNDLNGGNGYTDEIVDGSGPNPIPGNGPVAQQKLQQLDIDRTTLSNDQTAETTTESNANNDIVKQVAAQKKYVKTWVADHSGANDLTARVNALNQVAAQDPFVSWLRWALLIVGAAIDATALLLRLAGKRRFEHRRTYEEDVQKQADESGAEFEKDRIKAYYEEQTSRIPGDVAAAVDEDADSVSAPSPSSRRRLVAITGAGAAVAIAVGLLVTTGGSPSKASQHSVNKPPAAASTPAEPKTALTAYLQGPGSIITKFRNVSSPLITLSSSSSPNADMATCRGVAANLRALNQDDLVQADAAVPNAEASDLAFDERASRIQAVSACLSNDKAAFDTELRSADLAAKYFDAEEESLS